MRETESGGEYWDCGHADPKERVELDAPDEVDWVEGELLREWIDCDFDEEEFARRVKTASGECSGRSIAFTGVDPDGEERECPVCMEPVEVDPVEDEVTHHD